MLRPFLILFTLAAWLTSAAAEAPPAVAPGVPAGSGTQPVAVYDIDGLPVFGAGGGVVTVPFQRMGRPSRCR